MGQYELEEKLAKAAIVKWSVIGALLVLLVVITCMVGCPTYNVYKSKMDGAAVLAHAQSSREVAVAEAKAKMEAATMLAQADTIRAHGVARSNEIIGISLKNNEAYLHWLWIDNIEKNPNAVIYVPTETNLPILEAGKNRINSSQQNTDSK